MTTDAMAGLFSSRRPLALGFWSLLALGTGLFGWGTFSEISGAVIAVGQVGVESGDQVVEHADGGIVAEIRVRNGDRVEAGDVLVRLDDALLRSEHAIFESELFDLVARRNRLEAEFRGASAIAWSPDLAERAASDPAVGEILDGQQRLFDARLRSRDGFVAQLREQIEQIRRQIAGLEAQRAAVGRQAGFTHRELEGLRKLLEKNLTPLAPVMEMERDAAALEGQAGDIAARMAGARARIAELEIQVLQIDSRRIEESESLAREVQARENEVRERLAGLRVRLRRMDIHAPVAGTVHGITVFALDEVLNPGEPVAHVVPEDAGLIVKARLDPIHVDQVWPGQEALLRFSAFPARTTPEYTGRVSRVSADVMHDERTGLAWYEVELEMGEPAEAEATSGPGDWARSLLDRAAQWMRFVAGGPSESAERVGWGSEVGLGSGARMNAGTDDGAGAGMDSRAGTSPLAQGALVLAPGMPVEVYLRTGERSPLSYLVKPLTDYFSRSLREE